jgi:hypothetical protein
VAKATPTVTAAATAAELGGAVAATATVSGGHAPTGAVTFQLFAPGDDACAGLPVFTATVPLGADGSAASGAFTPVAAGSYAWRASYSGDADNNQVAGACGPSSTVSPPPPAGPAPPATPTRPDESKPEPEPDLRVKLKAPKHGTAGTPLDYRVTIANGGDVTAKAVELTTRLNGARAEVVKAKGDGCKGEDILTCRLGSLAPGERAELKITVLAKAAGRLTLTSTVAAAGDDARPGDDRAAASIQIARARGPSA